MTIAVIENLTEQIRMGCDYEFDDLNIYRMSTCQLLAYIYTYKAVSTTTLFNVSQKHLYITSNCKRVIISNLIINFADLVLLDFVWSHLSG